MDIADAGSYDIKSQRDFHFKLPVFEGPLDLLLHLIKENKLNIYDIPILLITRQYIEYLELMKELNLEIAGEFLVMAATLIHIKSYMLLPVEEKQTEEQMEDPRTELVQRLLEYQKFRDASVNLRGREEVWKNIFYRPAPQVEDSSVTMLLELNLFDLLTAFKRILSKAPEEAVEITRETLTVKDRINFILERLEKGAGIKFEDLFEVGATKTVLIVTFLAFLELVRLGLVRAYQEKAFGSIWIVNPQHMETTDPQIIQEVPIQGL